MLKHDIIDLNDSNLTHSSGILTSIDRFIQNATQFELVMASKENMKVFIYRWK